MAFNDNKFLPQVTTNSPQEINAALAKLAQAVWALEGRSGPVVLRDSLELSTPKSVLLNLDGWFTVCASRTVDQAASLQLSRGAMLNDDGQWVALLTKATILSITAAGVINIYANDNLTPGVPFTPTLSRSI